MKSWLNFFRRESASARTAPQRSEIPIFPINGVLFPNGALSLKVSEPRYLDMAVACMKTKTPFGVCLIASGKEAGEAVIPHRVGTLAHIVQSDMTQLGILLLTVRGGRRFRIISQKTPQPDGLLNAQIELLDGQEGREIPAAQQGLLPLLKKIVSDLGPEKMPEPHNFSDATWVGYRLTEIVPVQSLAKQKLLELDDPISRLEILFAYLSQRNLV